MVMTNAEFHRIVEGQTVPSEFLKTVAANGPIAALRWKNADESWSEFTYDQYADQVARVAAGLKDLGLEPGQRIVLMMRNCPEFHIIDLAAYFCGAACISIYNSSAPEQIEYLANHCEATLGIAEDADFLERFLKVRGDLHHLTQLGIVRDPEGRAGSDVVTYESLLAHDPIDLDAAAGTCRPDDLATVIYTSGTTGPPKGVMLTHYNIAFTVESIKQSVDYEGDEYAGKRLVSYLPMAHIAERMTSHYTGAFVGYEITPCPEPSALGAYLGEVRPNVMFGVPRVWEKFHAGIMAALSADPAKQARFDGAVSAAIPIAEAMDWGRANDEEIKTYEMLDDGAFRGVREMLGLDQIDFAVTGAAPIPQELLTWFRAIGVPLTEIYGMSETSGPMTWAVHRVKPGTVGTAIPGCEVRLLDDGEMVCRGGNVFTGYLNDPAKTAEAIDEDGWLHSGDIGEVDDEGYYRIIDRKKELIITAGGKNVSPANLEASLKLIPLVGQAAAIGDKRPFVSALVVLDSEVAPAWAKSHGIEYSSMDDLAENPQVVEEINAGVKEVMAQFNNAEAVKKVKILGDEWMPDSDMLTPTSKLKRRGISARYAEEIEAIYAR